MPSGVLKSTELIVDVLVRRKFFADLNSSTFKLCAKHRCKETSITGGSLPSAKPGDAKSAEANKEKAVTFQFKLIKTKLAQKYDHKHGLGQPFNVILVGSLVHQIVGRRGR